LSFCGVLCRQHIVQPWAALSSMLAAGAYARPGLWGMNIAMREPKLNLIQSNLSEYQEVCLFVYFGVLLMAERPMGPFASTGGLLCNKYSLFDPFHSNMLQLSSRSYQKPSYARIGNEQPVVSPQVDCGWGPATASSLDAPESDCLPLTRRQLCTLPV
jgi:hypothetical protein